MSGAPRQGSGVLDSARRRFDEVRLAIMFLTRLPVGRIEPLPRIADAMWAWPLAGALHGAIVGGVFAVGTWADLAAPVPALLAVTAGLFASGAFHEDGLADCVDGFGGGTTRAKKLEIMRDSRLGTYGASALMMALALKIALISNAGEPWRVLSWLVALGALTRSLLPLALLILPAAREDGMTSETANASSPRVVAVSIVIGLAASVALLPVSELPAIAAVVVGIGAMLIIAWRQIKGVTGDVLGASQVVGEISGLLVLVVAR